MNWFLISLVGPFLYAATNHIDKILLEKYFREGGVGTLILFSSFLSIFALPFIYLIDRSVMDVTTNSVGYLTLVSVLNLVVLWAYLMALMDEEATVIIVFYQLVPVFGGALGFVFLGETLSAEQVSAMAVVMTGTMIVSFEFDRSRTLKFRARTVFFMLLASLSWGTETTIFKAVALEENVWKAVFWEHIALVGLGVVIFAFLPRYRRNFVATWKANNGAVLALNGANETLYMVGNITVSYAVMLAPIALILLAESFQSIFVFLMGALLTFIFPRFYSEELGGWAVTQKLLAIVLTGYGAHWLVTVTP